MPEVSQQDFSGGVNASAPAHLVGENEVASATNVDFGLERGAAVCRRGAGVLHAIGTGQVDGLFRHYSNPFNIGASPWYAAIGSTVYRGVSGTFTSILTGGGSQTTFGFYKNHALVCNGTGLVKDGGTSTTFETVDWVKQAPASAPTVAISTLTALQVAGVYQVVEGTASGDGTSTATVSVDGVSYRAQVNATPLATNLNLNGTNTIGDYGVDYLQISFNEPKMVTRVSRDYSIGDANFTNYWHTEMDVELATDALPEIDNLIEAAKNATLEEIEQMISDARQNIRAPMTRVSAAKDVFNVWAVPRSRFELISQSPQNLGWDNIQAVRVVVEALGPVEVKLTGWTIQGAETWPLNDPEVGVTYWETWATIEDGAVVSESAESPASTALKCQGARAVVTGGTGPTGSHGLTHRLWYRGGGLLRTPYCVGTTGIGTATFTDTMTDIEALRRRVMLERNLLSHAAMWSDLSAISEPWHDRVFVMYENRIRWSLPGRPDSFPALSEAVVSHAGDIGKALVVWPPGLVILNRDSVYEMNGSVFEGAGQDWVLQRTGSRHGVRAVRTVVKTPYGIPLLDYDGFYMYVPGQGVDACVDWVMERLGDAWRGAGTANPAAMKGDRIPAINLSYLQDSCAAYQDGKLYLGVPTGTATLPNAVFAMDFRSKQAQVYTYPFTFRTLFWDFEGNKLVAGGDGKLIWLEQATADPGNASIVWSVRTRAWTTTADTVLENFAIEHEVKDGRVEAVCDNTSTITLGTLTATARDWSTFKMSGTYANNVWFRVLGTQTAGGRDAVYGFRWTALAEPPRVQFWRTEHDVGGSQGEKRWDTHIGDVEILGTGTVTGKVYVDGVVIMTATYTGPTAGRLRKKTAFPIDTFGDIAYTVYESSGSVWFKHWVSQFETRPEPNTVSTWKTDVESLEENIVDAVDFDIDPNGTVTSTVFVDNVAKGTYTSTGTAQQSFTHALPNETYGRTIYTIHNGTGFKHYKTWYHLRQEPDRWTNFVATKISEGEAQWDLWAADIDCLGNTVLATAFVDGTALLTATLTGSGKTFQPFAFPNETYGHVGWVVYNASAGRFKHYATHFSKRPEPERVSNYVTVKESGEEAIWQGADVDIDCLGGAAVGVCSIDGVAVCTRTFSGNGRSVQNFAFYQVVGTSTNEVYGRVASVALTGVAGSKFKPYNTWYHKRVEPDRWEFFTTERTTGGERWWKVLIADIDCLGGTVLGTVMVDEVAVGTYTFTGTGRPAYPVGLPAETYGNSIWVKYIPVAPGRMKHYSTTYQSEAEPERLRFFETTYETSPSVGVVKTWLAELNPLGQTVLGTAYVDGTAVSTATFTGTLKKVFETGLPNITTGKTLKATYASSTGDFKHYRTAWETEAKPFGKKTWVVTYKKIGGATQLDLARFFDLEVEPQGTATITSVWDVDGTAVQTNTLTYTAREWRDRIPFGPGVRGYLFQQRITSDVPVHVWRSSVDAQRVGVKGLARITIRGTPEE